MCNTCVDGYFKFTSDCLNCVDSFSKAYAVVYVFVLGGMIIVWISLNKLVAANLDAVDVSLLFLQVLDMIGKFELVCTCVVSMRELSAQAPRITTTSSWKVNCDSYVIRISPYGCVR